MFVCLFFFLSFFFLSEPWVGRTTKETFGTVWWLALLEFSHFKENHSLSLRTGMKGKQPAPWLSAGKAVWDRAGDGPPCRPAQAQAQAQAGRQAGQQGRCLCWSQLPDCWRPTLPTLRLSLGGPRCEGGCGGYLAYTFLIQRTFKVRI